MRDAKVTLISMSKQLYFFLEFWRKRVGRSRSGFIQDAIERHIKYIKKKLI